MDGRTGAVRAVADALSGRGFVSDALRTGRRIGELAGREAAFAMEIGLGTVRHLITIEHVLGSLARFDRERTGPLLRAVLCTAVYQIVWMDRIPLSAAVDRAVEIARALVRGRSPGMVNAVLRRVTEEVSARSVAWTRLDPTQIRVGWDRTCQFARHVLPEPTAEDECAKHLAAATGERPERYRKLRTRFGAQNAEAVGWASQALPPTVLHRNSLRVTPEAFTELVRSDFGGEVDADGDVVFLPPGVSFIDKPVFSTGCAFVQDATAHAAASAVRAKPGERVLDLCAAPGGKSVAMGLDMGDRGEIVASDSSEQRLALVQDNAARLGLTSIRTQAVPESDSDAAPVGQFDAALVDAPCSNSGVIARRPESRLGLTDAKLRSLADLQSRLLRAAAAQVQPGGRLIYSTCSIEREENEDIVREFLRAASEWRLDEERTTLPAWGPRVSEWRDGGYYARLLRDPGS